jgi:exosortase family protein XrtG
LDIAGDHPGWGVRLDDFPGQESCQELRRIFNRPMSLILLIPVGVFWLLGVIFFSRFRVWILYYLVGTVGLAYILVVLFTRVFNFELVVAHSIALVVHDILNFVAIPTEIFQHAPGVLLVLVVTQKVGWTVLQIGVESSGMLEISVLVSLVAFYPLWSWRKKVVLAVIGGAFTWLANVARMLIIALMLHFLGKEVLVLAHTFIGKAFFFIITIVIYWFLVTNNSLAEIKKKVSQNSSTVEP